MKKIILAVSLLMLALAPHAKAQVTVVKEVISSSVTINIVACSSFTATLMDSTTTIVAMQNRAFVAFQNQDASNMVAIGFSAGMSTSTANIMIPENYAMVSLPLTLFKSGQYQLKPLNVWCKTTKAGGSSNVALIQGY
jgi:hypothetical protein